MTVSVVPQNGFNGSVNVTLQGLPPGVNATPGSSFTLQTGVGRALLFSVTSSAAPAAIGYSFSLDTIAYSNGPHAIEVRAVDSSGNVAVFSDLPVTIQN